MQVYSYFHTNNRRTYPTADILFIIGDIVRVESIFQYPEYVPLLYFEGVTTTVLSLSESENAVPVTHEPEVVATDDCVGVCAENVEKR